MKLWSRLLVIGLAGVLVAWLAGDTLVKRANAQAKMPTPPPGQTAGQAFKNVTASTLKGLTVSDFLGAMGVMAAALGYDCADCHPSAGTDNVDWVFDTPKKKTARRMTEMVAKINKENFGGAQMVTCFTCHHGRDLPSTSIALDKLYGEPNDEHTDVVQSGIGVPEAEEIFDKYIAAVGGAQKLAGLKSWIATGTSEGYEGLGGGGVFQIIAKAPNQRVVKVEFKDHPERGNNTRVYDGKQAFVNSPRGLIEKYEMTGSELEGAKLDAVMAFPGQIKTALRGWRVGQMDAIGDMDVQVVQGSGPGGFLATLYFDNETGLLRRVVRFANSPIGRIPTQLDFEDYREVEGIKFPFKYQFSWLDGRDNFTITEVKVNADIPASAFARP